MESVVLDAPPVDGSQAADYKSVNVIHESNSKITVEIKGTHESDKNNSDGVEEIEGKCVTASGPINNCFNDSKRDDEASSEVKTLKSTRKGKRRSVSFAAKARLKTDSRSGEIELNPSFTEGINNGLLSKNADAYEESSDEIDMQMTVGLSFIPKENVSPSFSPKKICHSTPISKIKKLRSKPSPAVGALEEKNQDNVFICPVAPVHNLRKRSVAEDSKIYEQNDISKRTGMTNSRKRKSSTNTKTRFSDPEPIRYEDKVIQVSKTVFGSTGEGTSLTLSRKRSSELSTSYSYQEDINIKVDTKVDEHSKSLSYKEVNQSCERSSYRSSLLSTFESDVSCDESNVGKRVTFKGVSISDSSTTDYRSSTSGSSYYIPRNRKSVGFREVVSLIANNSETSTGNESNLTHISEEKEVDDQNLSTSSNKSTSKISIQSDDVMLIERNDESLLPSVQVPEIILTENEESNEVSKECSLYKNIVHQNFGLKKSNKKEKRKKGNNQQRRISCKYSNELNDYEISEHTAVEKWISPKLVKFLNEKLLNDNLDYVLNSERVISVICSTVGAVKSLNNADDIELTLSPLKHVLMNFGICTNLIEYYSFIMRFTCFEFQKKVLPLCGYFGTVKTTCNNKLGDSLLDENEKEKFDRINQLYTYGH